MHTIPAQSGICEEIMTVVGIFVLFEYHWKKRSGVYGIWKEAIFKSEAHYYHHMKKRERTYT